MNPPTDKIPFYAGNEVAQRFRFAGKLFLLIATVAWVAWFSPFDDLLDRSGTPLGGDFVMLYVAGQAIAHNEANTLYDDQQNQVRANALFAKLDPAASWPYRYPPTVAAVMAPISKLPFAIAWAIFATVQLTLLLVTLQWSRQLLTVIRRQPTWLWAMAGAPVVMETIAGGQSSLIALVCVIGMVYFLKRENFALAGMLMAIAMYKPNVLALFLLGCFIVHPRTLRGFVPTLVVGVLIAITCCGLESLQQYVQLTLELASTKWELETPFAKVHGLAPYFQTLLPTHGKLVCLLLGVALSVTVALTWRWRRLEDFYALTLLLVVNSLFNPYVPIYDLVLLIPALAFACEALVERPTTPRFVLKPTLLSTRDFQWLAGLIFVGPHLSQSLAPSIGYQPFPIVVVAIILALFGSQFGLPLLRRDPSAGLANVC